MATSAQATAHLERLDQIYLPDNGLLIEAPSTAIAYSPIVQLQYADEKLYTTPANALQHFSKEIVFIAKLKDNMELGQKFLALLYSYRSVSRGIPQSQTQDQSNRPEMYKLAYEVLKPQITKMKDLQKYCEECTSLVCTVFKTMGPEYQKENAFASGEFLLAVAEMLDLIMVLDTLKNAKASLNNDFSIYKRIWSNLKNLVGEVEDETMENHLLHNFLGSQNAFALKLKEKLSQVHGFDELMIDLVNHCATLFENGHYVKPDEKHMLLKAITFGLYLLDLDGGEDKDITKKKRLRLDRFGKIIKSNPVVPFFGDMTMTLNSFFVKTPKLSQQRWDFDAHDEQLTKKYKIINQIESIRSQFKQFVLNFKLTSNITKVVLSKNGNIEVDDNAKIYKLLLEGLLLMSDLNSKVLEQSAWKFANPTNVDVNPHCPKDANLYEMAVRYNYAIEERYALTEVISYIKCLSSMLGSVDKNLTESVYKHVYFTIQMFIKTILKEIALHVFKKKKGGVATILHHLFNIMSDNFSTDIIEEAAVAGTVNKGQRREFAQLVSPRTVSMALTQLHYVKVLLESLVSDKSKGMQGGFLKEKDFKDSHVNDVNEFLKQALYFPAMVSFQDSIRECSDLSELWYKEFYLEVTKQIQFPIEYSLPWLMTETILDKDLPEYTESVLYPLDIYNDAANKALHKLKAKFLYDEIEAEVNLCFDQFIWKLSQKVFTDFKSKAASYMLDKNFKKEMETRLVVNDNRFDCVHTRYATILKQKRFQLLGRSVCIAKSVAHFCNQHLRQSVDTAISRYEASDLASIIELENLLACARMTHKLLSEYMVLDPFDDILTECDERMSLVGFNTRIVAHTIQECLNDFIPNFCFNTVTGRFKRTPLSVSSEVEHRPPMPKSVPMHLFGTKNLSMAHESVFKLYKDFIGAPHFDCIARVVGPKHMAIIQSQLTSSAELMINFNITPYVKALMKGLPHSTKLPPFEYGAKGCFDYFQLILKPILSYRDLKSGVFQVFREFGNTILFIINLESSVKSTESFQAILNATMVGRYSGYIEPTYEPKLIIKNVMEEANSVITGNTAYCSAKQQGELIDQVFKPSCAPPLFDFTLERLQKYTASMRLQWETTIPSEDDLMVEHSNEFYRLWSAMLFCFSIPTSQTEFSNRELFGEGFLWAGCVLMHLFKEEKRFKAFDFVNFLVFVASNDPKAANEQSGLVELAKFFEISKFNLKISWEIFDTLDYRQKKRNSLLSSQ